MMIRTVSAVLATSVLAGAAGMAAAQEVNIYTSRHYDTDERLYQGFTEETGITVNRIEGNADELMARLQAEGSNSPADIFMTVDAGRIYRALDAGLLQSAHSDVLDARIPVEMRHPEDMWYAFSLRARVIYYDRNDVENPPQTYLDLANDAYEGMVCIRSSSNIYNLSLLGSIIHHHGEEAALDWATGVVENFARDPQGGDTDQLRGIVSGECEISIGNTYYFARALSSDVDGLTGSTDMIGIVFPNQETTGTHVNVSAAGITAHSPNRDAALAFLEYLSGDAAQTYFSSQNNEFPVVEGLDLSDALSEMIPEGGFTRDMTNLSILGENQAAAQRIFNEAGWE